MGPLMAPSGRGRNARRAPFRCASLRWRAAWTRFPRWFLYRPVTRRISGLRATLFAVRPLPWRPGQVFEDARRAADRFVWAPRPGNRNL